MNMMITRTAHAAQKRKTVNVQQLLEWAFRREKVRLELPQAEEALIGAGYGIGSAQRLVNLKTIGCFVDGGGSSTCHEDAEVVAAVLGGLPQQLGGRRFALQIAEWARMGATPDWMPGATPKVVPAIIDSLGQGGRPSLSLAIEPDVSGWEGRARACPIIWQPTVQQIDMARRQYSAWTIALSALRVDLVACGMLRSHVLTGVLPPASPWQKSS